ncbi:MAG: polymer-forming cytoskeletal protein [Phycisphaerales bacterium]|nr:polymer-forming cytoskeletal protein [Phycisphaerales bacterium]
MSDGSSNRIVRCCHCRGMMRVAARALSVFCPHCQKRVTLESLRIVGAHPGKTLATCGDILIEQTSQLNIEISANNVIVSGRVRGSVSANESIEVTPTGQVFGDVKAATIVVQEGGVIQGKCQITPLAPIQQSESETPPEIEVNLEPSSREDRLDSPEPKPSFSAPPRVKQPFRPQLEVIRPIELDD